MSPSEQDLKTKAAWRADFLPTSWSMAFTARTGLASPDRMSYFRSDELFLWQRRAAAWPFLLGTATYKSLLPAGRRVPACPAWLVTLSPWRGAAAGSPFPWARQGRAHPKRFFKAGRVSGSRQGREAVRGVSPFPLPAAWQSKSGYSPWAS